MGRSKELLIPAIIALVFIFLTAYGSTVGTGWLSEFCFIFHLFPFGIGFAGGGGFIVLIYYLVLWMVLTILFLGLKRLFVIIFKSKT